jgi:hypothetical protein
MPRPQLKGWLLFLALAPASAAAQGGPPLLTDDPGTPGPGRWEVNTAFTMDRTSGIRELGTPLVDANYGWGERVQLKLEMSWIVRTDDESGTQNGVGNPLVGVKWRFLDESTAGVAVSTYPQLELNLATSSVAKGLVEHPARFLLPVSAVKTLGSVALNLEIGGRFRSKETPQVVWGAALGREFGTKFEVLAEVFGVTGSDPQARQVLVNGGLRWRILEKSTILFSAGRSVLDGDGGGRHTVLYLGVQLNLGTPERASRETSRGTGRRRP